MSRDMVVTTPWGFERRPLQLDAATATATAARKPVHRDVVTSSMHRGIERPTQLAVMVRPSEILRLLRRLLRDIHHPSSCSYRGPRLLAAARRCKFPFCLTQRPVASARH